MSAPKKTENKNTNKTTATPQAKKPEVVADTSEAQAKKTKKRFFKSTRAAGLSFILKDGSSVRFSVFFDTYKGDKVRVGFLATDNPEVIARCEKSNLVEEISEKEFAESKELQRATR